jgi:membrane-associated phospholipid phosphatase
LSNVGNGRNGLYLIAGLGLAGLTTGSSRETETSVLLAQSLLTSAIWTSTIKTLTGRERPREMEEHYSDWEGPTFLNQESPKLASLRSFPSGHSTGAWAAATVLAHQYPTYGIIPFLAYGGAAAISYSRIAVGAHWLSDVVVGALIGVTSARQVISAIEHGQARSRAARGLGLGVDVSSQYKGVHLKVNF